MKRTGTLKLKIIKPIDRTWDDCGERMRATTKALAPALNVTMRRLYQDAQQQIADKRDGEKPDTSWQGEARRILREAIASELARALEFERKEWGRGRRPRDPGADAYGPVESATIGETVNLLMLSRFTGEHLKDLIACRSSFPSWSGQQAIYTEGRACVISGSAAEARLRIPLWGTGASKSAVFAVEPAGGSARAQWRKLVRDFDRRPEIVSLERAASDKKLDEAERERARLSLEEMGACKLGRVGWKYNKRKRAWFALLSWTEYSPPKSPNGTQTAAVNYGINVFAQALAEDGTDWSDKGADIRVTRERFGARRRSIQRALRSMGKGSRGHGKKRRYKPVTKLEDAEHRWTQSRIRMHAADLLRWCDKHDVGRLILHDMSGMREAFEQKTNGDAHEQVKRYIHSWPFYETAQAVQRQAEEFGVKAELRAEAKGDSSTCPDCGHSASENVQMVDRGGEYRIIEGRVFREVSRETRFVCQECGTKAQGDVVTCANMLVGAGAKNPLGKMQEKSRKRTQVKVKTIKAGKAA